MNAALLPHRELFWSRVDKTTTPAGCWLWTGATDKDGYGVLVHKGVHWRAHRAAWALTHGPLTPDVHLLHGCDTPLCCRPDSPQHLRPGTPLDNAADRIARGRDALLARLRLEAAGQLVLALDQAPPMPDGQHHPMASHHIQPVNDVEICLDTHRVQP